MYSFSEIQTNSGIVQYRTENLTGIKCRISPERIKRNIDNPDFSKYNNEPCPFCPENVLINTPVFKDGTRIQKGESITFPNLFPFARKHVVTVITKDHNVRTFSKKQIEDAIDGQYRALINETGYSSINWNFLPSAGASMLHPHMQGISDYTPSNLTEKYITNSYKYYQEKGKNYWDELIHTEMKSSRFIAGSEIIWAANPVPLGEKEIRGYMPFSTLDELESYIDLISKGMKNIIDFYNYLGHYAFNFSLYTGTPKNKNKGFRAFCSFIARINPNRACTSDTAFMERLHMEPVILTLPEDLGEAYSNFKINTK
ncbi:galactose-1-phosphate uridylyltransferase [Methanoplanus sp. FWC-SCC4]|uniref:Galactose-1-phosphate uridylyltransferase n=1 Tax=Methanochimaera problematica TaxID=2609417 RepID=A0AA97FFD3_9EURY|nr:galactose-1-phosphate uridylyltransferase [Methanoplanus sp. FWC-SCC4]